MLAEIYGWFSEGFDTTDLKEAKALLEELFRRQFLTVQIDDEGLRAGFLAAEPVRRILDGANVIVRR